MIIIAGFDFILLRESIVKDASLSQTYSFLPASWAGDTHEETDFLPIGDREVEERVVALKLS